MPLLNASCAMSRSKNTVKSFYYQNLTVMVLVYCELAGCIVGIRLNE